MKQLLTLATSRPPHTKGGVPGIPVTGMLKEDAREACAAFLARTEPAGLSRLDDRRAMIDAVIEISSIGRDQLIAARRSAPLLVVEGWVYRACILPDGSRQIADIFLPGDFITTATNDCAQVHELRSAGQVRIAQLKNDFAAERNADGLRRRWQQAENSQSDLLRARLASLGRRNARGRVAYLLVEFYHRLRQVNLAEGGSFECPLTQTELADALGLTPVHVNRTLQSLRRQGLVSFGRPHVHIPDLLHLSAVGGLGQEFDVTYRKDEGHVL